MSAVANSMRAKHPALRLDQFGILAANVPGHLDTAIVIAASRRGAGEIPAAGLLNLEMTCDGSAARAALHRVARLAHGDFAVKLSAWLPLSAELVQELPANARPVILTGASSVALPGLIEALRNASDRAIFIEVTSAEEAAMAIGLQADALLAKGQEAGGVVGEETSFILLQRLLAECALPVWVMGGIGPHSIAACYAGGARGVVLDNQLLLTAESTAPARLRAALERAGGDETVCIGRELQVLTRLWKRPGMRGVDALEALELALQTKPLVAAQAAWRDALCRGIGWKNPSTDLWLLGQDSAFAATFAARFGNVAGVIDGLRASIREHVTAAQHLAPLGRNSALAQAHQTEYPILQGPMTRVSDTAEFANAVAEGGGLPFLALALLRGPQVRRLMERTRHLAASKSWGVGILGFVPTELREEQLAVVRDIRPPFAIIAGGRPDQAASLEKIGIATYLHVPAPPLLRMFIEDGARRFIFEGRECGGHVGPRTSFVLWEAMIDTLLEAIAKGTPASELQVVFAGGIHDAQSAAMVAAMAAPLAQEGVKLGVLMGTAYLFTEEAVQGRAINSVFQKEAIDCRHTVILESGPGHATRCVDTPFADAFRELKQQMRAAGKSHDEIKDALEALNVGRLRIASKGMDRAGEGAAVRYFEVTPEQQLLQGMYMIGQIASLRNSTCTVRELHAAVSAGSTEWLQRIAAPELQPVVEPPAEPPCDIAIVGVSCILPKASDVREFWANIVNRVNAITPIPKQRFDVERYYDADKKARDKMYSKWGGFLADVAFDPMRYGIPPNALASIDPMQLLGLVAVEEALQDSGYNARPFDRSRTSVILGMSGGLGDVGLNYAVRTTMPEYIADIPESVKSQMPEWTEDTFAGILLNVTAGRIANRFDFGGVNFTVDAACASSLAATAIASRELTSGSSDMVIVGGVDTLQSPFGFMCFAKSQALSPRGQCRPFDESADGIAISEGVTMLVLKRLSDAERAGDRIYAVIKGVAGSSDGRGRSMTAPRPEGQMAVLRRAYRQAGFGPSSVGLFEAHGTGTAAGDAAEIQSLSESLLADGAKPGAIAVGSVKSMVGHTKAAAGVTGLLKIALALYHKVLPATINVEKPNPRLNDPACPVYANTATRPWIRMQHDTPLRAGVSSFGFGGTNFHAVLEEYTGDVRCPEDVPAVEHWPAELFLFAGAPEAIASAMHTAARSTLPLRYIAAQTAPGTTPGAGAGLRLAIIARSHEDLAAKIATAKELLASGPAKHPDKHAQKSGIYLAPASEQAPQLAFLFPGQGSQQPDMLRDLAIHFPEFRLALERADQALSGRFPKKLSDYIYPPPVFTGEDQKRQMTEITATAIAQPALGAVEIALTHLLARLGVLPDMTAGHSYGEYTALAAAGVITEDVLFELSERRGNAIEESTRGGDAGTMAAVLADAALVEAALNGLSASVTIANYNSPKQTIIAGAKDAIHAAITKLADQKIAAKPIPVACAFHSPLMQPARERLAAVLDRQTYSTARAKVFSNTLAAPYPAGAADIAALLASHLVKPVRFVDQIRAMHDHGARVFLEVGPKNVLSNLAKQNLEGREVSILTTDGASGLEHFLQVLGQLFVAGIPVEAEELYRGRLERAPVPATRAPQWMVNGAGAYAAGKPPALKQPVNLVRTIEVVKEVVREVVRGVATPVPVTAAAVPAAGPDTIIVEYQRMMQQFLTSQTAIMQSYFAGSAAPTAAAAPSSFAPLALPSLALPPPPPPAPAPAAPGALATVAPAIETPAPVAVPASAPAARNILQELTAIVADRTGYPSDMLDPQAAIEADLGIDSIKRVEILSAFQRTCTEAQQAHVQSVMEKLTSARTLLAIADHLAPPFQSAAPAAPEAQSVPAAPPAQTRDLLQELTAIVADRTGYPSDMLDPQAAIEADLGIDSIKRVEILSAFQRTCTEAEQAHVQSVMEKLTSARTLQAIADFLKPALQPALQSLTPATSPGPVDSVARFTLTTTAHSRASAPQYFPGRVVLITDDENGIASAVADAWKEAGERVLLLRHSPASTLSTEGLFATDLTDAPKVNAMLASVRQQFGPVGALLHLLPLQSAAPFAELDLAAWRSQVQQDVRSFYLLAKAAEPDLKQTGKAGGALLAVVTGRGGEFGLTPGASRVPAHFAVADFLKTLALEFPEVLCKVVDIDPSDPVAILRRKLSEELACRDEALQIGLPGDHRLTVVPQLAPLAAGPLLAVDASSVVLLTGGARGITAGIARTLAQRAKPTLILAGASALPASESEATAHIVETAPLKAALLTQLRAGGSKPVKPAEVEAAYSRLMKNREIQRNLADLAALGSTVEYHALDVRDETALGSMIDDIYARFGRLDVVIHGAGVIEDKLLKDKTPESFDRVVHTKTDSTFVLTRKLRPADTKCLILMSSITAAFGNRGQADYAAANGAMNGIATMLAADWPGRIVAMNWGPWDQAGMVSDDVRRQFLAQSIIPIPPAAGNEAVMRELALTEQGQPIAIFGEGPWRKFALAATEQTRVRPLFQGD